MTFSESELREQRDRVHAMPAGEAKFGALDDLLRHADAAGQDQFAYETRMQAIQVFQFGGEPLRAMLAFSQCLAAYDGGSVTVRNGDEHSLLWRFKWIADSLPDHPQIPIDQALSATDDMERRYRLAGYSMRAVYQARWAIALGTGDVERADEYCERMARAPQDAMSDCRTCFPSHRAQHHATRGRYEEAIRVGGPASQGTCVEQPHWLLAHLVLPYLFTGRHAEAVNAHRKSYRRMRTDRKYLGGIGVHLRFCALSGNTTRGLEIIERHLGSLDRASSPAAAMSFAAGSAVILTQLVDAGHGDLRIRRPGGAIEAGDLRTELVAMARDIAARFDTRNANTYESQRLEAALAQTEPITRLPLSVAEGAAPEPAAAQRGGSAPKTPSQRTRTDPRRLAQQIAALADTIARSKQADDACAAAIARFALAQTLGDAGHIDDATETAEEALRELRDASENTAECQYFLFTMYRNNFRTRSEATNLITDLLAADPHPLTSVTAPELREQAGDLYRQGPQAVEQFRAAATAFRAAGAERDELRTLRKLLTAGNAITADEAVATIARGDELSRSVSPAVSTDPDESRELTLFSTAAIDRLMQIGRLHDALERAEHAVDQLDGSEPVRTRNSARLRYADLLIRCDRPADGEIAARTVLVEAGTADQWWTLRLVARALDAQGRTEDRNRWLTEHNIDITEYDNEGDD
jgi:tetratricopeptide (TPR) repeat protein